VGELPANGELCAPSTRAASEIVVLTRLGQAAELAKFGVDQHQSQALINASFAQDDDEDMDIDALSCIVDYTWLSDANRSGTNSVMNTPRDASFPDWSIFGETMGGNDGQPFDLVGQCVNSFFHKPGRESDWWFDTGGAEMALP
jgi:hypothetical protein